jgi:hypothetical protein
MSELSVTIELSRLLQTQAFDTNASTTMSVCDEYGSEIEHATCIARFAPWPVSPIHHR